MAQASVRLKRPLDEAALLGVGTVLRRSFAVTSLQSGAEGLSATVSDDVSDERLREAMAQVLRVSRHAASGEVFAHEPQDWRGEDAQPALEARGDVRRLGPGLFAFRGDFLAVRTALDGLVRAIAVREGAEELAYPPLWPVGVLRDINYFHDFPQLAMLAPGVTPEFSARARFSEAHRKGSGTGAIACTAEDGVAPAANALAPTVCDCCYWLLRGRSDVADAAFTIHGTVFRNESSATGSLERLTAYTMREVVVIGSEGFVLARRESLLEALEALGRELGLRCTVEAADDPFFCNDALQKGVLQGLARLKYELRVVAFEGRAFAAGSLNLHNDFFSRNYGYALAGGGTAFSACMGIGLERLAYALFCRHGVDLERWPAPVRALLGLGAAPGQDGAQAQARAAQARAAPEPLPGC